MNKKTTLSEKYSLCLKLTERIEVAVKYLRAQKDVDTESGRIFMPVTTARYIIYTQAEMFPGYMMIWDPACCDDETVRWFGCRVNFVWALPRKVTVEFVQKIEPRVFRQNNGMYVKIPGNRQRICIDIPIPEELQKWPE